MFGIDLSPEGLLAFFSAYAYRPTLVYGFIVLFMMASSFGFPVPEELVLISSGLVAYMGTQPGKFPPPHPGAEPVDVEVLMVVCFLAVFLSDTLVYMIGKVLGVRLLRFEWAKKQMSGKTFVLIEKWFEKYGIWCAGIFRFTPGLRFPGHLACGLMKIPVWKFLLIDGFVALISVPTQVWLVATYGEVILDKMQEFKLVLLGLGAIGFIVWLVRRRMRKSDPVAEL